MSTFKVLFVILVSVFAYYILTEQKYNSDEIQGLRVVVTGASAGIGREVARQLAQMGARVFVTARTESKLQKVVEECKKLGSPEAYHISADMNKVESPEIVIKEALDKLGGIDMLVLNHVGGVYFTSHNDIEAMKKMFQSNTISYAHLSSLAMESLNKNKGRIAVVSSVGGFFGIPFLVAYGSTKSALKGYFRGLDHELAVNKSEVSVTIFHLGAVDTEMAKLNTKDNNYIHLNSKTDCAAEIIKGAMKREHETFFPSSMQWIVKICEVFPGLARRMVPHVTNKS